MHAVLEWLGTNGHWVFSGIGVFALSLLVGRLCSKGRSQTIKGQSSGIQAGRDVKIKSRRK